MKKILYISTILYILLTSITYSEVIEVSNSQLKSLLENNVPIIDIRREIISTNFIIFSSISGVT